MPDIRFLPSGLVVLAEPGTRLLEAAREAGIELDSPCGGKGTCGRCIVRIASGDADSESLGILSRTAVAEGYVLACTTRVLKSPLVVEIPERSGWKGGQFTDAEEDLSLVSRELLPTKWEFEPLAMKWLLDVPEPRREDGLSDIDRLTRSFARDWGRGEVLYPLSVLRKVADALRAEGGKVTVSVIRDGDTFHIIDVESDDRTSRHYGLAVDIGTTTIAVQLVFLPLAKPLGTRNDYNAQVSCGLDVISRINYARSPGRLEELRELALGTVNRLIALVCEAHDVRPEEIANAVVAGNPTMIHLALGLKPEYLRLDPYTPTASRLPYMTAREVGIDINPESWVYFCPSVGSYVGGDITAGILCTDIVGTDNVGAEATEEGLSLFIDIGTNGEIVIGNRDFLMTCACSAGPAFEGGGIECGMRAAVGAIERVRVDPATGSPTVWTVGGVKPLGICGSGMICLLSDLYLTGWMDGQGRLSRDRSSPSIEVEGRRARYLLAPAEESGTGKSLYITEIDIDNIIRAKAAIFSACSMILEKLGLSFDDLERLYIAGGFGRFLDIGQAVVLGLLPDLPRERFTYLGNSSLTGAYMVLVSRDFKRRMEEAAARMTYIDLGSEASYMDHYTASLFIPHTDLARFPSVARYPSEAARKSKG
ncbi:MAG: ASKHA domain-containing protein [Rectinemataceae bacterium]